MCEKEWKKCCSAQFVSENLNGEYRFRGGRLVFVVTMNPHEWKMSLFWIYDIIQCNLMAGYELSEGRADGPVPEMLQIQPFPSKKWPYTKSGKRMRSLSAPPPSSSPAQDCSAPTRPGSQLLCSLRELQNEPSVLALWHFICSCCYPNLSSLSAAHTKQFRNMNEVLQERKAGILPHPSWEMQSRLLAQHSPGL